MINLIIGEINCGKTTKLIDTCRMHKGEGYALTKAYCDGLCVGQDIQRLSDNLTMPFSRIMNYFPTDWDEAETYDIYSFSKQGLLFAKKIITDIIESNETFAYIDDIGPLELSGKGVDKELSRLMKTGKDLTISIRRSCLNQFIARYLV